MSSENNNDLIHNGRGYSLLTLYPGLSSDELTLFEGASSESYLSYYQNSLNAGMISSTDFWGKFYQVIFKINAAIEGIKNSTGLTPAVKNQLLGESHFLRAFTYFYLVQLYGDVPLVLMTDYNVTSRQEREKKEKVYAQMIADLTIAKGMMEDRYLNGTLLRESIERVRPNRSAAIALLARIYLYNQDWENAEAEATAIINKTNAYEIGTLDETFKANSKETIWALQPIDIGPNSNTGEGRLFILPESGPSAEFPVYLSNDLVKTFEVTDQRLSKWVGSRNVDGIEYFYSFKYKIGYDDVGYLEYPIVLRLSEQFLIRAEVRAEQGNFSGAKSDLDVTRHRAGLEPTSANDKASLIQAITKERQHELFTEWGHRWFDLKRLNLVDNIMAVAMQKKGGMWDSRWSLYPIPLETIQRSNNILQNPGY